MATNQPTALELIQAGLATRGAPAAAARPTELVMSNTGNHYHIESDGSLSLTSVGQHGAQFAALTGGRIDGERAAQLLENFLEPEQLKAHQRAMQARKPGAPPTKQPSEPVPDGRTLDAGELIQRGLAERAGVHAGTGLELVSGNAERLLQMGVARGELGPPTKTGQR